MQVLLSCMYVHKYVSYLQKAEDSDRPSGIEGKMLLISQL